MTILWSKDTGPWTVKIGHRTFLWSCDHGFCKTFWKIALHVGSKSCLDQFKLLDQLLMWPELGFVLLDNYWHSHLKRRSYILQKQRRTPEFICYDWTNTFWKMCLRKAECIVFKRITVILAIQMTEIQVLKTSSHWLGNQRADSSFWYAGNFGCVFFLSLAENVPQSVTHTWWELFVSL